MISFISTELVIWDYYIYFRLFLSVAQFMQCVND